MNHRVIISALPLALSLMQARAQDSPKPPAQSAPSHARPVQRVKPAEPVKQHVFHGKEAHVYFNEKTLTWKIGNDVLERTIQYDRDSGSLRTTQIKTMGGVPRIDTVSTTEGEFSVVGADGQKRGPYRLDHDWAYIWQSVGTPPHGGRLLTIHLQGVRTHSGVEVEVLYEVYPGNRPFLAKTITLINRGEAPIALADVVYDRWVLPTPDHPAKASARTAAEAPRPAARPQDFTASGDFSMGVEDSANRVGLRAFVNGKGGEIAFRNGTIAPEFAGPLEAPRRGGRAFAPFAVIFAYTGPAGRGTQLYQEYDIASAPSAESIKDRIP